MMNLENNMLLYHGSDCIVKAPDLNKCKSCKDFGKGFYLSFDKKQAERFADIVRRKNRTQFKYVNLFRLIKNDDLKILIFEEANEDWFKFVCENRSADSYESKEQFDIIVGKIADDATATIINNYLTDEYGDKKTKNAMKTALGLLLPNRLKDQICFKTEKALKCLSFVSFEELKDEKDSD